MNVSAVGGVPANPFRMAQETERQMLALQKVQDAAKVQAEGMLALIQQASPGQAPAGSVGGRISVYA